MENKIIIYTDSVYDARKGMFKVDTRINKNKLTTGILYWDKVVIPRSHWIIMKIDLIDRHPSMIDSEIIERPYTERLQNGQMARALIDAHMDLLQKLLSDDSANYIAQDIEEFFISEADIPKKQSDFISLINALPIPSDSVDLGEVMEFRHKRGDELRNLMIHINSIESRLMKAENKAQELRMAVNEIDRACYDAIRLHKENKIKFNLHNANFSFSMKEIIACAGGIYGGAKLIGMPETAAVVSGLAAGVASTLKIDNAISFKKIDKSNPFNYVGQMSVKLS